MNVTLAEVWIVQHAEYENESVVAVSRSLDAAIAALKADYPPPYIVKWDEPEIGWNNEWTVVGRFEKVLGYATGHTATFTINRWDVVG